VNGSVFDRLGFDDFRREFTGGPEEPVDRLTRILRPRGGTVADGLRLACINGVGLIVGFAALAIVAVITRLLQRIIDLPFVFSGFLTALVLLVVAVWIWYRYARAHGEAARARGREVRADVFGAVAASPFAGLAAFLACVGFFSLLLAMVTLSGTRALDALRQLGFALLFLGIALGNIVVARAASE
jgi:hypothetical protein